MPLSQPILLKYNFNLWKEQNQVKKQITRVSQNWETDCCCECFMLQLNYIQLACDKQLKQVLQYH